MVSSDSQRIYNKRFERRWVQIALSIVTSVTLLAVSVLIYEYIFVLPGIGLTFSPLTGSIDSIDMHQVVNEPVLKIGDVITRIGGIAFSDYTMGSRPPLTSLITEDGQLVIQVVRDGQEISTLWQTTGQHADDVLSRILHLLPAISFLGFSVIVLLFLRPMDVRWVTMNTGFNLTAIWLATGIIQPYNLMHTPEISRVAVWLAIPFYLHLAWYFPRPLARLSPFLTIPIYLACLALAAVDGFRLLPANTYILGLIAALILSLVLISLHNWSHPEMRRDTQLLVHLFGIGLLPSLVIILLTGRLDSPVLILLMSFQMPWSPLVILYVIYHRRLGGLELRANQAFTIFIYSMLLIAVAVVATSILYRLYPEREAGPAIAVCLAVITSLVTAFTYPRFTRWTRQQLFSIPIQSEKIVQVYASRISTSLDRGRLAQLLCDEIFPALLIREAALIYLDDHLAPSPYALYHVAADRLPEPTYVQALIQSAGSYRWVDETVEDHLPCSWARLVLVLKVEGRPIGLCLLGRRDPDDFYPIVEIPTLQSLMDQTALALYNIDQANRLQQFHLANIERQEGERAQLARELHDEVLGQLALLAMNVPEARDSELFRQAYQSAASHVRSIINGLRPTMLAFGLRTALDELVDEVNNQVLGTVLVRMEVPKNSLRYPQEIEMHIYRIIQQALQNAIRHSQASEICITGQMEPDRIHLEVSDNGSGFDAGSTLDLISLLNRRHFGLAGMYERAELIHADLHVHSTPGQGTQVAISWNPGS